MPTEKKEYLHLFETQAAHDAAYSRDSESYDEPWVAYTKQTSEVSYNLPPRDYTTEYLTFEILEDGNMTVNMPASLLTTHVPYVKYSKDNGTTWTTISNVDNTAVNETISVESGDKVLLKSNATQCSTGQGPYYSMNLSCSSEHNITGNIMSLLYEDEFSANSPFKDGTSTVFRELFTNNAGLIDASNLKLPAMVLNHQCYRSMFYNCSSLETGPELPATNITAEWVYGSMFGSCTSLTSAPALPSTTLTSNCYQGMFQGCTSLTTAPVLPALTLTTFCYEYMFKNCSNLNYIKAMFTTTPGSPTNNWVDGVAATGTFVKNIAAEWSETGVHGIPSGWTVQTASE